jgi:allantoicase
LPINVMSNQQLPDFLDLPDLASAQVGGAVLACSDEFFAPKENLIRAGEARWIEGKYTDRGKWMDGWESRRRRAPGYDWAILRLGLPGVIHGVVVDTSHFRGNYPAACSIEACSLPGNTDMAAIHGDDVIWREILSRSELQGNTRNRFAVDPTERVTHVRLNIYPDGGVARLRVHGQATPAWDELDARGGRIDLAAIEHGGQVLACSDEFFGRGQNLIMPGLARSMAEGWETRRRRGEGYDWVIVRLGARGVIDRAEIDTSHFLGNAPGWCSLEVCATDHGLDYLTGPDCPWQILLPRIALQPGTRHMFADELAATDLATHARLNIYPDGGVARLRLFGLSARSRRLLRAMVRLAARGSDDFHADMLSCCGSSAWARAMLASRPFADVMDLERTSDRVWAGLDRGDWLEAFAAHPRIGENRAGGERSAAWSRGEQSRVTDAGADVLEELAAGNQEYHARFGYTFIVCATGKSAETMLQILRQRLENQPDHEIVVAAEEQRKITRLRLRKLLSAITQAGEAGEASEETP